MCVSVCVCKLVGVRVSDRILDVCDGLVDDEDHLDLTQYKTCSNGRRPSPFSVQELGSERSTLAARGHRLEQSRH